MVLQSANSHLEELVEPRREDGQELHALEKRERGIRSKINEAIREVHPGQLTVEEAVRARDKARVLCDIDFHNPDATV